MRRRSTPRRLPQVLHLHGDGWGMWLWRGEKAEWIIRRHGSAQKQKADSAANIWQRFAYARPAEIPRHTAPRENLGNPSGPALRRLLNNANGRNSCTPFWHDSATLMNACAP